MSALEVQPARPPTEENETEKGIRIASFDGGGPGSYSQLLMLKEVITRLEYDKQSQQGVNGDEEPDFDEDELCPGDYFDMMGGVGFGAYCALMLGHLRLTIGKAIDELSLLADEMFPNAPNEIATPEANSEKLKDVVEEMLQRNRFPVDMPLKQKIGNGRQCKVVIFVQATSTPGNCTPFRTYHARSAQSPKCTFVEAACAALCNLPDFSPVAIGIKRVKTLYCGIPLGFNNPTRKVLEEAYTVFGEKQPVSLILSLGAGEQSPSSTHLSASINGTLFAQIVMDSKRVDDELTLQLKGVNLYLRLDVDGGLKDIKTSDWHKLSTIGARTQTYLGNGTITMDIDKALRSLCDKEYLTFAQLNGAACQAVSRVSTEMLNDMRREFKDMRDIITQGAEKIIIIDAIGKRTSIPLEYCTTYEMLQDMVKFYFKHQKPPGSSFVDKGEYKIVYGGDRKAVKPGEWTYLQAPNLTLEMSIVVRKRGYHIIECPKCTTKFQTRGKNGWWICSNRQCKMRYQCQEEWYRDASISIPKAEKDGRSSMSQAETVERVDQFRLVSVVHWREPGVRSFL